MQKPKQGFAESGSIGFARYYLEYLSQSYKYRTPQDLQSLILATHPRPRYMEYITWKVTTQTLDFNMTSPPNQITWYSLAAHGITGHMLRWKVNEWWIEVPGKPRGDPEHNQHTYLSIDTDQGSKSRRLCLVSRHCLFRNDHLRHQVETWVLQNMQSLAMSSSSIRQNDTNRSGMEQFQLIFSGSHLLVLFPGLGNRQDKGNV